MSWEVEHIGPHTLYRGDCLALLADLQADAVVSDPPYGIGYDWTRDRRNRQTALRWANGQKSNLPAPWTHAIIGDREPFDPTPFLAFPQIILWGGHHYSAALPQSSCWLVWDKRDGMASDNHGDCELAWTNFRRPTRLFHHLWRGVIRAGADNATHGAKQHPAQKPIELMRWCVAMTTGSVLDPFMGSGTTGVACVQLGRVFTGIEIERQYFDIACQRMHDALRQPDLFVPTPAPVQQRLFVGATP